MTTTVVIANQVSNQVSVKCDLYNIATAFELRSSAVSADGLTATAEYLFPTGDPTVETTVSVQVIDDKSGKRRCSIRLRSAYTVTVDSVVMKENQLLDTTITWVSFGPFEDPALLMRQIATTFGLTFATLTSAVPDDTIVAAINRRLVGSLYGA